MSHVQSKQAVQVVRSAILNRLNDAEFHSGEDLATQFSLSRSAISNHIKALCELGLDIYSVKGRGYKLESSVELLSHGLICKSLTQNYALNKHELIQVSNLVSSTNDIVKQQAQHAPSGTVCLAEAQSAGRGRRGRTWVSPFGSSLYLSMLWHFELGYQAMSGLSLMVGVVLNNTLQQLNIKGCQLKWPNDVFYEGQKLAGILIEVEGQAGGGASAIIGIGANIQLPNNVQGIDQAFTDLSKISPKRVNRNQLASLLIENLWQALPIFEEKGLEPFMQSWQQADLYYNRPVKLLLGERLVEGMSKGIDANGALLLETSNGITAYHGGEISVRPA